MHRYFLVIILSVIFTTASAQNTLPSTSSIDSLTQRVKADRESFQKYQDSMDKVRMDRVNKQAVEQMSTNLDSFMAMRREQEAKQRKQNMIRIGLGVFFLIVLGVGIARRRKKK